MLNQEHTNAVSSQAELRNNCMASKSFIENKDCGLGQAHDLNKGLNVNTFDNTTILDGNQDFNIDLDIAKRFLTILAQTDESDEFTFQVFPEGQVNGQKAYPQILHGTLVNQSSNLAAKNRQGCGVYVTVNQTDGKGRKEENILKVRALFIDLDGSPLEPVLNAPIKPHIIIESSPERFHAYWIVENVPLKDFSAIQKALAKKFAGDPSVNDLSRVMRLPGFYHLKKTPQQTKIIFESSEQPYSIENFLSAFQINFTNQVKSDQCDVKENPILKVTVQIPLLRRSI